MSKKLNFIISLIFVIIIIISFFLPVRTRNWIWAILFFAHAIISIISYSNKKRIDNLLVGIGLTIIGILSILNIFFIINITWIKIWLSVLGIIILSYIINLIIKNNNS
jgi:hypothetical protein